MRLLLEIQAGPQQSRRFAVAGDSELFVGPHLGLEDVRFSVQQCDGGWVLRCAEDEAPALLNGVEARKTLLSDGDVIRAGGCTFAVRLHALPSGAAPWRNVTVGAAPASWRKAVAEEKVGLFAVLNAAADDRVLQGLRASEDESQCLYDGMQLQLLSEKAPYLVRLNPAGGLFSQLLSEGLARHWGILCASRHSFAEVRKHLRKFVFAKSPRGEEVYFRFYDGRVLNAFLPAALPEQLSALFQCVESFWMLGSDASLLRYSLSGGALVRRRAG
jgi:hypothetical protein